MRTRRHIWVFVLPGGWRHSARSCVPRNSFAAGADAGSDGRRHRPAQGRARPRRRGHRAPARIAAAADGDGDRVRLRQLRPRRRRLRRPRPRGLLDQRRLARLAPRRGAVPRARTSITRARSAAIPTSAGASCSCPRSPAAICSTTRATSPRTSPFATPTPRRRTSCVDGLRCGRARACTAATTSICSTTGRSTTSTPSAPARRIERRKFEVALHAGLNRLNDLYQYETLDTPPRGLGPAGIVDGARPPALRQLAQADAAVRRLPRLQGLALRRAAPAARRLARPIRRRCSRPRCPSDIGWVGGRAARRLAAAVRVRQPVVPRRRRPRRLRRADACRRGSTRRARCSARARCVGALSVNWESHWLGVMGGAYLRRFNDASTIAFNPAELHRRASSAIRPHIYWNELLPHGD